MLKAKVVLKNGAKFNLDVLDLSYNNGSPFIKILQEDSPFLKREHYFSLENFSSFELSFESEDDKQ